MLEYFKRSFELINGNLFLNNCNSIYKNGFKIVSDPKVAIEFAQSQQVDGADDWTELEEKQEAKLSSFLYAENQKSSILFRFWQDCSEDALKNKIPFELNYSMDEIVRDLYCIGVNSHFAKGAQNFYSVLDSVYELGGWPCGWAGAYPVGSLVVYARNPLA